LASQNLEKNPMLRIMQRTLPYTLVARHAINGPGVTIYVEFLIVANANMFFAEEFTRRRELLAEG
jgi:hypothetical protein